MPPAVTALLLLLLLMPASPPAEMEAEPRVWALTWLVVTGRAWSAVRVRVSERRRMEASGTATEKLRASRMICMFGRTRVWSTRLSRGGAHDRESVVLEEGKWIILQRGHNEKMHGLHTLYCSAACVAAQCYPTAEFCHCFQGRLPAWWCQNLAARLSGNLGMEGCSTVILTRLITSISQHCSPPCLSCHLI